MISKAVNLHLKPTREVGFVLKPHGFKGQMRISLDGDYLPQDFLLISINNKFVPYAIEQFNTNSGIIKLKDINDLESAEALSNLPILELIDEQEYNSPELLGYTIIDQNSGQSFEITNIVEYPGNTLIEFRTGFKDALIPMHEDIITEIDHNQKIVKAIFPEGLLDL